MASSLCACSAASGAVGSWSGLVSNSRRGLANSSTRSSVFGRSIPPGASKRFSFSSFDMRSCGMVVGRFERNSTRLEGKTCWLATYPFSLLRRLNLREKVQNLRVGQLEASKSADEVPSVESNIVSLWDNVKSGARNLFSAGFTPEVVIGRIARLGFLSATTVEFETGKGVLQQLTFRGDIFAVVVAVGVLLMSIRRKNEDGAVDTFNPSGLFTPSAERVNGQAAMLGCALMVAIESAKGSALF